MKSIHVLSAFMLLLLSIGGISFSSADLKDLNPPSDPSEFSEFLQDTVTLFDSHLSAPIILNKVYVAAPTSGSFNFGSSHLQRTDEEYINYAQFIHPGLGVADIIFPFHSFL